MSNEPLTKFIEAAKAVLDHPPYLIFVFLTSVFMFVSTITSHFYEQSLILFLYSIFGAVWRHVIKDIRGRHKDLRWDEEKKFYKSPKAGEEYKRFNFWLTLTYQIINVAWTIVVVLGALISVFRPDILYL